jgi:NADH:ubiquinone oxidoreductase subunit 6 (subunit J)
MLALSVLFLLLSAQFVFVVQVIVYAGAVMVLFLFVVTLLGPIRERGRGRLIRLHWAFSVLIALAFFGVLWAMLGGIRFRAPQQADLSNFGSVQQIGIGLFTSYLFPFELTSVLLLVDAGSADALPFAIVHHGREQVGFVTSGGYGHRIGRSLALAFVERALARPGTRLELDIFGTRCPAMVCEGAAYDPDNSRMRE